MSEGLGEAYSVSDNDDATTEQWGGKASTQASECLGS